MTRPAPFSVQLLDRPVPADVAAQLLGADPALFQDAPRLLLREAFRLALRPLIAERHLARGARRSELRKEVAARRRAAAAVHAERLTMALRVTARQLEGDISAEAEKLSAIDPAAGKRLRCAAARASAAAITAIKWEPEDA